MRIGKRKQVGRNDCNNFELFFLPSFFFIFEYNLSVTLTNTVDIIDFMLVIIIPFFTLSISNFVRKEG